MELTRKKTKSFCAWLYEGKEKGMWVEEDRENWGKEKVDRDGQRNFV